MEELERKLLAVVSTKGYRPVKPRKIAKALGLDEDETRDLKKVIKRLVKAGKLAYGASHTVRKPGVVTDASGSAKGASESAKGESKKTTGDGNRVTGIFRRMSSGYGFVRPTGPTASRDRSEDIYITQKDSRDAASGDVVLVQLGRKPPGKRKLGPAGSIVEVLQRETHRFVGTYFERAENGLVQVDGKIFQQPILVGDAGAKSASVDDKVVIEMVRFPSHVHEGEAVVVEVLGRRGEPGVDTMSIIHEFGLPGDFEEDVLDVARQEAEAFDESIGPGRRDLTGETVITIDPFDARDFDDAISLQRLENGHWQLGVHIADVSHFVKEKSALDTEAKDRATSVYLPDRVIPMLPEIISNNLASLQPNRVRYTKTVFIEFTPEGVRVSVEACSAAIRSDHRFNYEEVDDYLADPAKWKTKLNVDVDQLLGDMHSMAMTLRRRRFERGSLEMSMPDVKIDLDKEGRVTGAHTVENTESHQMIEEFMLAANEAVADLLREADYSFLRRVHEAPDPRKLKLLNEFVGELGLKVDGLESRFELQKLLGKVAGRAEQHAVNYAVLRSMQKAVYSPIAEGHYALASDCYCHFTSPIRRYPDLTVHRLLDRLQEGRGAVLHVDQLMVLGEHCSDREQRAEKAERELIKVKLLNFLSEKIGEEMEGVVTGVMDFGLFVQGIELPAEGLVHITSLQDDYYQYDKATHTLSGRRRQNSFRLGDFVRIAVAHVDVDARELDFRLVGRPHGRPDEPHAQSRQKSGAKRSAPGRTKAAGKPAAAKKSKRKKTSPKKSPRKKPPTKSVRKKSKRRK